MKSHILIAVLFIVVAYYFLKDDSVLAASGVPEQKNLQPIVSPSQIGPSASVQASTALSSAAAVTGIGASALASTRSESLKSVTSVLSIAAPFLAVAGLVVGPLVNLAKGPQADDTITGEIKKHFGVSISKQDVINYYYSLGFETEGSKSAYRFAVQIVLSPKMLLYLYSKGGEEFMKRLREDNTSKGYVYGQDWTIPLQEYLNTGNASAINILYYSIFSEKVPSWFRFDVALIP